MASVLYIHTYLPTVTKMRNARLENTHFYLKIHIFYLANTHFWEKFQILSGKYVYRNPRPLLLQKKPTKGKIRIVICFCVYHSLGRIEMGFICYASTWSAHYLSNFRNQAINLCDEMYLFIQSFHNDNLQFSSLRNPT